MRLEPVTLEGRVVRLEPLRRDHHAALCSAGLDPELWRWTAGHVDSAEEMRAYIDRALAQVDPVERAILRLGVYELEHEPTVPVRVILDEAVELARVFGTEQGYRFVNGVLDHIAREVRGRRDAD